MCQAQPVQHMNMNMNMSGANRGLNDIFQHAARQLMISSPTSASVAVHSVAAIGHVLQLVALTAGGVQRPLPWFMCHPQGAWGTSSDTDRYGAGTLRRVTLLKP